MARNNRGHKKPFEQLGGWSLEARIGRGGQGDVWRVRKRAGHVAPHAMKIVTARDDQAQLRFEREVALQKACAHPHVVPIVDDDLTWQQRSPEGEAVAWIVLPLARCALDYPEFHRNPIALITLVRQALDALGALHARPSPVFHRDLKPSNILVFDAPERAALSDFGLATEAEQLGEMTLTGEIAGSRFYTSPECLRGGAASIASDIYSIGRILERGLTGQIPDQLIPRPIPRGATIADELCETLDRVILKCTATDPSQRYQSIVELLADVPSMKISAHMPAAPAAAVLAPGPSRPSPTVAARRLPRFPPNNVPLHNGVSLGRVGGEFGQPEREVFWKGNSFGFVGIRPVPAGPELMGMECKRILIDGRIMLMEQQGNYGSRGFWYPRSALGACVTVTYGDETEYTNTTLLTTMREFWSINADVIRTTPEGHRIVYLEPLEPMMRNAVFRLIQASRDHLDARDVEVILGLVGIEGVRAALPQGAIRAVSDLSYDSTFAHAIAVPFDESAQEVEVALKTFFVDLWKVFGLTRPARL